TWILDGAVLAAYYPAAGDLPAQLTGEPDEMFQQAAELPHARPILILLKAWLELSASTGSLGSVRGSARRLRKHMAANLARVARSLSIALSRRLVRTPVTPNHLTTLSLVVGLLGAALLTSADYWIALLAAILLWSSCILDGCDGEVARLKLLASTAGARFDQMTDNLVHLATFLAIVVHVHRVHPEFDMRRPGLFLVLGVALS